MTTVYDVPPGPLIERVAIALREKGKVAPPPWSTAVKTGVHREKPPVQEDWWYVRCASILRKVYVYGPIGTAQLSALYGGPQDRRAKPNRAKRGSGSIARHALAQLEESGYLSKTKKGRAVTPQGRSFLDNVAHEVVKTLPKAAPKAIAEKAPTPAKEAKPEIAKEKEKEKGKERIAEVKKAPTPTKEAKPEVAKEKAKERKAEVKKVPTPTKEKEKEKAKERKAEVKKAPTPTKEAKSEIAKEKEKEKERKAEVKVATGKKAKPQEGKKTETPKESATKKTKKGSTTNESGQGTNDG